MFGCSEPITSDHDNGLTYDRNEKKILSIITSYEIEIAYIIIQINIHILYAFS